MDEKLNELIALSEKVAEYLQNNFHPHITVVIEPDNIRVEELVASKPIEYVVD